MTDTVAIRVYEELNRFLADERHKQTFPLYLGGGRMTIAGILAHLQIPADQVDLVLINGRAADPATVPAAGDRIAVYPVFETLDIASVTRMPERPLRRTRFVADADLLPAARLLRRMGFDTLHLGQVPFRYVRRTARRQARIILTRREAAATDPAVTHVLVLRGDQPIAQVREVLFRLHLTGVIRPYSRCLRCNRCLAPGLPAAGAAPAVLATRCPDCHRAAGVNPIQEVTFHD